MLLVFIQIQNGGGGKGLEGFTFNGKPVISPSAVSALSNPLVLIMTPNRVYFDEIKKMCNEMGVEARHIDEVIFKLHANELLGCMDIFSDEESKKIFSEMAIARAKVESPNPKLVTAKSCYNLPEFSAAEKEGRYVDCGAFVGDSIERYIIDRENSYAFVKKIFAFEPDRNSYNSLKIRVDRLKKEWNFDDDMFTLYNAGVGDSTIQQTVSEEKNGMSSKIVGSGKGRQVQVYALDDIIKERVSYIKADIESFEFKMLIGAKNIIQTEKTNLALCIYHNAADFYQIPQLVHEICPDYRMIVRQHSYLFSDTILYAWV